MRFGICTLDEFDLQGKTVLCRVDMNQPVDREAGTLKSTARIEACAVTVKKMRDSGAKVVLLAHQGSDIEYKNYWSTEPHAKVLSELLGSPVKWIDDVCGPAARAQIKALKNGEVLLLDNVRFMAEEQTLFETNLKLTHEQQAKTQVVAKLAPLADLYVCDAFAAAHRDQPTLCGFEQLLPSAMGLLFEKEYCVVSSLMEEPERPCTFVLGGAKIADAFMMMSTVLDGGGADRVLTGGLVANIMLIAAGKAVGKGSEDFIRSSGYWNFVDTAKEILAKHNSKIVLPVDLAYVKDGKRAECPVDEVPGEIGAVDIGTETAKLYAQVIAGSRTIFMNGPMGVFEKPETAFGTESVMKAMADSKGFSVIGGGDSVTAAKQFGVKNRIGYICTGGGALIRFLTGEELPVVKALRHAAATFGSDRK